MNHLATAIKNAYQSQGNSSEANKVYIEFIKANLIIPVEKNLNEDEEPKVLFLQENNHFFLPVFTEQAHLDSWASTISDSIHVLKLSGVDLLKGIEENVTVCLDIGSELYKEFNQSEIARMKSLIIKFFK